MNGLPKHGISLALMSLGAGCLFMGCLSVVNLPDYAPSTERERIVLRNRKHDGSDKWARIFNNVGSVTVSYKEPQNKQEDASKKTGYRNIANPLPPPAGERVKLDQTAPARGSRLKVETWIPFSSLLGMGLTDINSPAAKLTTSWVHKPKDNKTKRKKNKRKKK